jgi:hypothetical protein
MRIAEPIPDRLFRRIDSAGKYGEQMTREELFELLASGDISWSDQVWKEPEGLTSRSGWRSVTRALCIPKPWSLLSGSNRDYYY